MSIPNSGSSGTGGSSGPGSLDCGEMRNFLRLVILPRCEHSSAIDPEIFVDFENAQPRETELEIYNLAEKALKQAECLLKDVSSYKDGASESIRKAIMFPSDEEAQEKTWNNVIPLIIRLREYYRFSQRLEQILPLLLWELCCGPLPASEQLEMCQALAKQFAHILDFVLRFDELKMHTPAMQNDFSFYRRTMSRKWFQLSVADEGAEAAVVPCDEANTMSLFYAQATPMLTTITNATERFVHEHPQLPVQNTTDTLGTMATVCRCMANDPDLVRRFAREAETQAFCLRVMVGSIILYDHLHPPGAFSRSSIINMKSAIRTLKEPGAGSKENLLNALRYTTKHANDSTTPKGIKALLAAD